MRAVALAALLVLLTLTPTHAGSGCYVVVTFSNLVYDVEPLLCEGDVVEYLAPPGVDPHNYQLSPSDVEKLRRADLVVSTAHAPFEVVVKDLIRRGELRALLVEIPEIPGVKILSNPVLGTPNYHMPIYDPVNYVEFITYLANTLSTLRPECSKHYRDAAARVASEVRELVDRAPKLSVVAAADTPLAQYAVTWLGVDVKYLVIREHGAPASPSDVSRIREAVRSGKVRLAVVAKPPRSKASEMLKGIAGEAGIPVIYVPQPFQEGSIIDKLRDVLTQALSIAGELEEPTSKAPTASAWPLWGAGAAVTAVVAVVVALAWLRRRSR